MFDVPKNLQSLADQIDGWLDLRCPDKALALIGPLLGDPAGRAAGLERQARALVRLGEYDQALAAVADLRGLAPTDEWAALTEAYVRKRTGDLPGAIRCLEGLVLHDHKSAIGRFNLGCYLALAGHKDRAIDELSLACGLDDQNRDFLRDDADLDALRTDPRFRALLREERAKPAGGAKADAGIDEDEDWDDEDEDDDGPPRRADVRRN